MGQRKMRVTIGSLFDPANARIWTFKTPNASVKPRNPVSPRKPFCGKVSPAVRRPVAPPTSRFTNKKDFLMQLLIEVQQPARFAKKQESTGSRTTGPTGGYGIPGIKDPTRWDPRKTRGNFQRQNNPNEHNWRRRTPSPRSQPATSSVEVRWSTLRSSQ